MKLGQPLNVAPFQYDYVNAKVFTATTPDGPVYFPYPDRKASVLAHGALVTVRPDILLPALPYSGGPGMGSNLFLSDQTNPASFVATSAFLQGYDVTTDPALGGRLLCPLRGVRWPGTRVEDAQFVADTMTPKRIGQFGGGGDLFGFPAVVADVDVLVEPEGTFLFPRYEVLDGSFDGGEILSVVIGNSVGPVVSDEGILGLDAMTANVAQAATGVAQCARFLLVVIHLPGNADQETIHAAFVAAVAAAGIPHAVREFSGDPAGLTVSGGLFTQDVVDFFTPV